MEQLSLSFKQLAEWEYEKAVKEHNEELETLKNKYYESLHDLDFCASLGLPPFLPKYAIEVLSHTMTINKLGPKTPLKSAYYRKYGINI